MADSLFDSRYRYDYIYPRGRSGETLRAVDTQEDDRAVVIKRPAPNDAPPIRAGQEVSILNERKALMRLANHPAATALLGGGQFVVGGVPHQYIVMERAEGSIVADEVLQLAAHGERLPELEMLVIVDMLLDLLIAAHAADIVYNDVDAKHLFWDRDNYRLKVIDWGNAVFLEGDESTPQGISRQSDIFQTGELLYFILTGGGRADVQRLSRETGEDFRVDFGRDADRVHSRLQAIISRALHPNLKLRYRSLTDLRKDLTDYRAPLERERNTVMGRVSERLRRDRSKDELRSLLKALEPVLMADSGFPPGRELQREILDRLSDIEVAADLDAARIYLESGNWSRAVPLLDELRERARSGTGTLINLLLDWTVLLVDAELRPVPQTVFTALALAFEHFAAPHNEASTALLRAAHALLTAEDGDAARHVELLMAERISAHVPEILLLRPNLYRLESALGALSGEGVPVDEPRALLTELYANLNAPSNTSTANLIDLRDRYRVFVDGLTALGTLLEAVNATYNLPNRKLPLTSLERGLNAAMALADNMHVIGKQAAASPRDALAALDNSRAIDPGNPLWEGARRLLDGLYERLQAYQVYVPSADGSDLAGWLETAQRELEPFSERLFDEMLVGMIRGLNIASRNWEAFAAATVQGNRLGAITALATATDAVGTVSPTLAGWLNQLRAVVTSAQYIERHALYGGLGRALADGWDAFDKGRLDAAEQLGQRATEAARSDPERFAARRLRELAEVTRAWVERNGVGDSKRTGQALAQVEALYTVDEHTRRDNFAAQMPSKETYLKAMGKGLVELFGRESTAAVRVLFMNFAMLGVLDAHEGSLEDAEFWRDAALKTMGEAAARHPAVRALEDFIQRRRDLLAASEIINRVNGRHALPNLEGTRKALEENAQARLLTGITYGLREIEAALRDWSDGEFRAAGIKLENALKSIDDTEAQAGITLTGYRAWLMDVMAAAAELHAGARQMAKEIDARADEPRDSIRVAHHRQVEVTTKMLGEAYAAQLRVWRDTYDSFLAVYTDRNLRRSGKITRFNDLFRAMFIDRHPAYPLYRHWFEVTESQPEFPAPATDEPTPRLAEGDPEADVFTPRSSENLVPERIEPVRRRRGSSRLALVGAAVAVLVVVGLAVAAGMNGGTGGAAATDEPSALAQAITETASDISTDEPAAITEVAGSLPTPLPLLPPQTETLISRALSATPGDAPESATGGSAVDTTEDISLSALASEDVSPEAPTPRPPSDTPTDAPTPVPTEPPTATPTSPPLATPTPSFTPSQTVTFTPSPTLPPGGLRGAQDVLAMVGALVESPWSADTFTRGVESGSWRLGLGAEPGDEAELIAIPLSPELLEMSYGAAAAGRVLSLEATLTLTTFNPALLPENKVYFGALLQNAADPAQSAGLQVQVVQPGVVALAQRQGVEVQPLSQRSVTAVVARVRLERSANGTVTAYFNGEQIGQPMPFSADTVQPVLFVHNGGVIVSITEWTVTLE